MYYIIIVILTVVQTLIANWLMGLPVFEASPYTVRLWCNYLAAAMVLWSPLLFTTRRRWTYIVAVLMDIWFIGNLMYFRSYGDVLNRWCLLNVNNMDGIWSSVLLYLQWSDMVFPLVTVLWIVLCETTRRDFLMPLWRRVTVACVVFVVCCAPQTLACKKSELPVFPFSSAYAELSMGRMWYMHNFGALTHLANEAVNVVAHRQGRVSPVTDEELARYIQTPDSIAEQGNLLIILFESLEDRIVGLQVNGQAVTPNINRLAAHPMTGHYPMTAQVREGKSSDAQLMLFNGLLPIRNGAASMRYAGNTYPSFVRYSQARSKRLFAAYPYHMWNQHMNAYAYGFDTLYAQDVSDRVVADSVRAAIRCYPVPFVYTMVTMASHSPFTEYADSSSLRIIDSGYSESQTKYLQCVHYTDSVIGGVLETILSDSVLAATTRIVITGDHPVFDLTAPVPFVIYDPYVQPVSVSRPMYQIDIYTTLAERMHIATPWRGLGKNISDTCAYTPAEIRNLESLSDRLIRTDYFK